MGEDSMVLADLLVLLLGLFFGLADMLAASGLDLETLGLDFTTAATGLLSGVKLVLLLLLCLTLETAAGVSGFLFISFLLPKFSVKERVSVTVLFLSSNLSNLSPGFSALSSSSSVFTLSWSRSDTSDNVSVTVLFLSSS